MHYDSLNVFVCASMRLGLCPFLDIFQSDVADLWCSCICGKLSTIFFEKTNSAECGI